MSRKMKMIVALFTTLALLTTGTFTMFQTVKALNEFSGQTDGGVNVHDDFDPNANMKDVFVENNGSATIYVRAKLDEAMSLLSHTWRPSAGDWRAHTYGASAADCGHTNAAGSKFHDYFKWTMGGSKWYMPTTDKRPLVQDTNLYDENTPGARRTPYAAVITAAEWLAKPETEKESFIGWIYDVDGYAYWSQPLEPQEATGLLLHGVRREDSLKNYNYYYAINVIVETVDIDDVGMMRDGDPAKDGSGSTYPAAEADGKEILDWLTNRPGGGDPGDGGGPGPGPGDDDDDDGLPGDGDDDLDLPVNPGPFAPIYNGDPDAGDGYYAKADFTDPGNTDNNHVYHQGAIHLEEIITDGDYGSVSASAEAPYSAYISVGNDRHGKPSILYSYFPTNQEWIDWATAHGNTDITIPVLVTLTRGDQSATVTINMIYPDCPVIPAT